VVEVRAPVVIGIYPMRIARLVVDHGANRNSIRVGHFVPHLPTHPAPHDDHGGDEG